MQMFSRVTNSVVITATLVAVIIGSLCFSAGEGLRLTPFPSATLSFAEHSDDLNDVGTINEVTVAKYGPLDIPTQQQKRTKRQSLDLVAASLTSSRAIVTTNIRRVTQEVDHTNSFAFIAPHSGRAPPFQS
jgi:hypothetical protein